MSAETIGTRHARIIRTRHERLKELERRLPRTIVRRNPVDQSKWLEMAKDGIDLRKVGIRGNESAKEAVAKLAVLAPQILDNRACEVISLDTYEIGERVVVDIYGCAAAACDEWYVVHGTKTSEWRERLIDNLGDTTFSVHNDLTHDGAAHLATLGQYTVVFERVEL